MKVWVLVASLAGSAVAFPSLKDLQAAVSRRQFSGSTELLGDLATLPPGELSDVGKEIKAILLGHTEGRSSEGYRAPAFDSPQCRKDECCVWKYIADELYSLMHDDATDTCNDFARGAIRMGFHDAAAWDKTSPWGGADGSLLLSNELTRQENIAMTGVGARMKAIYDKYTSYGISMADLLQAGAKVGVLACPGGPRIRMFVGRPEDKTPAPVGLLPPVFFTADQLIDLFANKTVSPGGLVALIGAHTASRNHSAASTVAPPQDRTPGKWDTEYFSEQLRPNASAGVFRFPSDVSLAQSPRTGPVFHQFSAAKGAWDEAYAKEYIRMSLMGVKKINTLRECSKVLPKAANKLEPDEPEPSSTPSYSTSVLYQTQTYTVTSCPPDKKNCPYGSHATSLILVSTTTYEVPLATTTTAETDHHDNVNTHGHTNMTSPVQAAPTTKAPVPVTAAAGCLSASLYATAAMVGFLHVFTSLM